MKKVLFKTMVGAGFTGMLLAGCANDIEDLFDPTYEVRKAQYRAQWIKQFGEIDPNENWGFDAEPSGSIVAMTRAGWANTSANEWGRFVEVPAPLTEAQKNLVTEWFKNNEKPEGISVNWSDFFVQQVSSNENGQYHMSYLVAGEDNCHMNNFNGGDCTTNNEIWDGTLSNPEDMNSKVFHSDKIQFMQGTGTSRFGFQSTLEDSDRQFYYNYVIIPGERIDASLAGMYFLGFDFESNGSTEEKIVARDFNYADWIIKVTPAIYNGSETKRIICEDLGEVGDFDFNDIVFDAYIQGDQTVITVLAAGGTLPVSIGGVDVHVAFGVKDNEMVNTGATNGKDGVAPAIFRIPTPSSYNLKDIKVEVRASAEAVCVLDAPKGDAPQKIAVSTDFEWPTERQNIKEKYPNFPNAGWEGNNDGEEDVENPTDTPVVTPTPDPEEGGDNTEGEGSEGDGTIENGIAVDLAAVKANNSIILASYFTSSSKVEIIITLKEGEARYIHLSSGQHSTGFYFSGTYTLAFEGENVMTDIQNIGGVGVSEIDFIESITIVNY